MTLDPLSNGISRRVKIAKELETRWIDEAREIRRKKIKTPEDELRFRHDFGEGAGVKKLEGRDGKA